jgi:hypothetical protein
MDPTQCRSQRPHRCGADGDLAAEQFNLGYAGSALAFAAVIAAIALSHYSFGLNGVLALPLVYLPAAGHPRLTCSPRTRTSAGRVWAPPGPASYC